MWSRVVLWCCNTVTTGGSVFQRQVCKLFKQFVYIMKEPDSHLVSRWSKDNEKIISRSFRFMWRKHPQFEETGITLITSLWTDIIPPSLDAVYENWERNEYVFFKGNITITPPPQMAYFMCICKSSVSVSGHQYWKLKQLKLEEGFPRNISDLGFPSRIKSIDAALHFRNGRYTVFFTGHECWTYVQCYNLLQFFPISRLLSSNSRQGNYFPKYKTNFTTLGLGTIVLCWICSIDYLKFD